MKIHSIIRGGWFMKIHSLVRCGWFMKIHSIVRVGWFMKIHSIVRSGWFMKIHSIVRCGWFIKMHSIVRGGWFMKIHCYNRLLFPQRELAHYHTYLVTFPPQHPCLRSFNQLRIMIMITWGSWSDDQLSHWSLPPVGGYILFGKLTRPAGPATSVLLSESMLSVLLP